MRRALTYTVREVAPYINWLYYFHTWGMEPRFASVADVHNCPSCRATWIAAFPSEEQAKAREAMKLYDEAMELLRQWADEPICHALFLLSEAYSEGDDIVIDGTIRIPFLRQQHAGKKGYTLCLSDFIRETSPLPEQNDRDITNTIGIFATGVASVQLSSFIFQFSTFNFNRPPCRGYCRETARGGAQALLGLRPRRAVHHA